MFKKLTLIAAFSSVVFIQLFAQAEVNIRYIANEGYIIEDGELKIACDVFFDHIDGNWCDSPSEDMTSQMRKSNGIFNGIDLITVSHKHIDHFDCDILTDHMLSNKKAIVICPEQVKTLLVENDSFSKIKERVIGLNLNELCDTILNLQNISINTLRLEHSPYMEEDSLTGEKKNRHQGIQNFAYMFNTKPLKFFHSGDANPLNKTEFYTFFPDSINIDIAFFDRLFFSRGNDVIEMINETLNPRHTVLMHISPKNKDLFSGFFKDEKSITVFINKNETISIIL